MKRKIRQLINILAVSTVLMLGTGLAPASVAACTLAPGSQSISGGLFEVTPWYKYLPGKLDANNKCRPDYPKTNGKVDIAKTSTLIIAAVFELLFKVAGIVAAGYVIYGAFQYITSQGEPEGLSNAKNTITNSLIGFVIVMLAIAIVQFIGRAFRI